MKQPCGKKQVFSTCTLKELCPEDKQKVAKLVKQVVELGQENQRLKDAADKAAAAAEEKLRAIQECNKEAVQDNASLKAKLGQAVTVLRMYHHKVQGLDAALRAVQHAAPAAAAEERGEAQQPPQQQEQLAHGAPSAVQGAGCSAAAPQQPERGHAEVAAAPLALLASASAAKLEQQAQLLCGLVSTGKAPPAASETAAAAGALLPAQPQGDAPPTTPLVLPLSHCEDVRDALHGLAAWQLQQGLAAPEQAVQTCRRVLQFDPSIGSHGAFVLRDLEELAACGAGPGPGAAPPGARPLLPAAAAGAGAAAAPMPQLELPPVCGSGAGPLVGGSSAGGGSLCESAPWGGSPTCRQLLTIAKAFDSLAASASPAHTAGGADGSAALPGQTATAAAAAEAARAAAACANPEPRRRAVGLPRVAAGAVEEVPVEALEGDELPPVLVRNEKSASSSSAVGFRGSLLAPAALLPGPPPPPPPMPLQQQQCDGVRATCPVGFASAVHPDQHHQQWQRSADEQHPPQRGGAGWPQLSQPSAARRRQQLQQEWVPPTQAPLAAQHSWAGSSGSCTPSSSCAQLLHQQDGLGPAASAGQSGWPWPEYDAASAPPPPPVQPHGGWQGASFPGPAMYQQQWPYEWPQPHPRDFEQPPLGAVTQQCAASVQPPPPPQQQQQQQLVVGALAAPEDARELLERFDESLVDLLAEVERLEHQQMAARRQLQHTAAVQPAAGPWPPMQRPQQQQQQHRDQHWAWQKLAGKHQAQQPRPASTTVPLLAAGQSQELLQHEEGDVCDVLNHLD